MKVTVKYRWCRCLFFFGILVVMTFCQSEATMEREVSVKEEPLRNEQKIIDSVMQRANHVPLHSSERRRILDSAIAANPKVAYLYQQRAMPLYKQHKDELGLPFLDKAAELHPAKYLDYSGFMKCIFSKNYRAAIIDFKKVLEINGESYVMDHTYYFYIGLSYLQLNEFEKAKEYLQKSIAQTESEIENGREWVHFLDLMYLGIVERELQQCEKAIVAFDEALLKYPSFGDVKYYKARCLLDLGQIEDARNLFDEAKEDILKGNTINEDNVFYEVYPYQVEKYWFGY